MGPVSPEDRGLDAVRRRPHLAAAEAVLDALAPRRADLSISYPPPGTSCGTIFEQRGVGREGGREGVGKGVGRGVERGVGRGVGMGGGGGAQNRADTFCFPHSI